MSRYYLQGFFYTFEDKPLKYSSLYTRLQIILKCLYNKVIQQIFFEGRGIFEIIVTNQNGHENVQ